MRILVFLLIFANLIFFACTEGYFGGGSVSEAGRLETQVQPERLHLMWRPGEEPDNADKVVPPKGGASAPENGSSSGLSGNTQLVSALPANLPAGPALAPGTACLLVSGLTVQGADDLEKKVKEAKLETRRSEGHWWVFIPPQGSKGGADKKAGELRQFGVMDFFIVADGPQQFAISLGVFSQEEGARRHLEFLRGKGVRSARIEERQPDNVRTTLEIRGVEEEVATLRKQLPAEVSVRTCPQT
jgi:hypothetical protein